MKPETQAAIVAEWQAAAQRPGAEGGGFRLPGDVYSGILRFEAERDHVLHTTWIPVARVAELEAPGAFRTLDLVGIPVLLTHAEDGRCRAFVNACIHRGAQIVREEAGQNKQFHCPYHNFTYSLSGNCTQRPVPDSFPSDAPKELRQLDLEVFGGWIWIRAKSAGDSNLAEFLGEELCDELANWPFESAYLQKRQSFEAAFDWKVGIEAFLESFHLPAIHKRTAHPLLDFTRTAQQPLGLHSRMSTPFRVPTAYEPSGPLGSAAAAAGIAPFPELNEVQRTSNFSYHLFPATILNLLPTHFTLFRILPAAPGHCRFEYELYTAEPSTPAAADYNASLEPGYQKLLEEDLENLAWIQKGIAGGAMPELCLSAHERRILHFHKSLDSLLP